jgi:hypothetical protein
VLLAKFRSKFKTQDGYAGIASSGRDAVTGHSVGYELIKWISRPIGTDRDETVVPVTSRVCGGSRAFSSWRWLGI